MDNRETLTPSSGDAILERHLSSEVARNWIKGRGHIERAYFVRRPSRQSFGFRVAASSGPIPKAPGSAGGYLDFKMAPRTGVAHLYLSALPRAPVANANVAAADKAVLYVSVDSHHAFHDVLKLRDVRSSYDLCGYPGEGRVCYDFPILHGGYP